MATLSYSVTQPALRSPVEEWQPHGKQSESTTEWWYLTALVHDIAGNSYFLVWCPFHIQGPSCPLQRSDYRRDRDGERTRCPRHSQAFPALFTRLRECDLRSHPPRLDRVRIIRPREG